MQGRDAVVVMAAHNAYRDVDLLQLRRQVVQPILVGGCYVFSGARPGSGMDLSRPRDTKQIGRPR